MSQRQMHVTVSGSFRRAMSAVQEAVYALTDMGATVLSPADPRVVDEFGAFVFVASDRLRSVRLVQERHLEAIRASDFVWLVAPDGYVGLSAAMEVGFATACCTPVFSCDNPRDLTLRQFISVVPDLKRAVSFAQRMPPKNYEPTLLVDPGAVIDAEHHRLEVLQRSLLGSDRGTTERHAPFPHDTARLR